VATTSNGRSRRLEYWFVSAAAVVAAALPPVTDPDTVSAPDHIARGTISLVPSEVVAAPTRTAKQASPGEDPIGADAIERALLAAPPGTEDLILERLLASWTSVDPQAAVRFAELQTNPFLREVAQRTVAQRWARIDAAAAALWASSLGDETERDRAIGMVALAMSEADPRGALELLAQRASDAQASATRIGIVGVWAASDFPTAQSWVEAQAPGSARDSIVQHLVFLRAQTDPSAAASLASQLLSDEKARHDAYASIIGSWIAVDPDSAFEWAASIDQETRRRVDEELASVRR
jgi:hypothetical protein